MVHDPDACIPVLPNISVYTVAKKMKDGTISIPIETFTLDEIVVADQAMKDSVALAKTVVLSKSFTRASTHARE
jgi:hypothetical protein